MSGFTTFGLGASNPVLATTNARWKPEKGNFRVSFVGITGIENKKPSFDSSSQILLEHAKRLYVQGVGYFVDHGPEYQRIANGKSKIAIATTLAFWPVNAQGKVDIARVKAGEYEIKTWIMSLDKYNQLVSIHQEYPLTQHDVLITVTDPQYHKMSFSPRRDSLFKILSETETETFSQIVDVAHAVHSNIRNEIAQDLTIDQIRQKISGEVGSPVGDTMGGSSLDADDVLDSVLDG